MPKTRPPYPEQFRREAVGLLRSGRSVRDVAESLGVSQQTLRNWSKQEQADRGERHDTLTSAERDDGLTSSELRSCGVGAAREAPGAGA